MTVKLTRSSLDLGIVTDNGDAMLSFYRDTLGLEPVAEIPFPGTGTIHKHACGDGFVKVLVLDAPAATQGSKDGFTAATGIRYFGLDIANLEETVEACRAAGHKVAVEIRDLRPGVKVAMIEDPDGNTLELMGPG